LPWSRSTRPELSRPTSSWRVSSRSGGSGYALAALWRNAGLTPRHLLAWRLTVHETALVSTAWSMILLGVAYIAAAFDAFVL